MEATSKLLLVQSGRPPSPAARRWPPEYPLYAFCAVHFDENRRHDPEVLPGRRDIGFFGVERTVAVSHPAGSLACDRKGHHFRIVEAHYPPDRPEPAPVLLPQRMGCGHSIPMTTPGMTSGSTSITGLPFSCLSP